MMSKFICIVSITLFKNERNETEESPKWMVINPNYIQYVAPFGDGGKYYAISLDGREELILINEIAMRDLLGHIDRSYDIVNILSGEGKPKPDGLLSRTNRRWE